MSGCQFFVRSQPLLYIQPDACCFLNVSRTITLFLEEDERNFLFAIEITLLNGMNYQALFSYFLLLYSCSSSQTKPKLTRRYLDGDKYVFVIDNLFPAEVVRGYYGLVTSGKLEGKISSWFYAYNDYYQNIETFNTSSNSPWVAPVNPEFFSDTALWNISRKVVEKLSGGREYFPYDVTFSMHRRLDFITASSKGKGDIWRILPNMKLRLFFLSDVRVLYFALNNNKSCRYDTIDWVNNHRRRIAKFYV